METISASQPWADKNSDSSFQMIDVGGKVATARTAFAQGTIHLSQSAYDAIEDGTNPKGDVLALAEITAIQGAKNTSVLLPLCHPLPIEKVRVHFVKNPSACSITVFTEVSTTGKTGVEMEALAAVNAGLLGIYDLSKAVDPVIELSNIRLDQKIGGKSGHWKHPKYIAEIKPAANAPSLEPNTSLKGISVAVLTLSDRCFNKLATDTSGPTIVKFLTDRAAMLKSTEVLPDEISAIQKTVRNLTLDSSGAAQIDLLVLTGGTGLSPTDHTPEALASLWTKPIPGIGELLRASGARHTPMSYLSRSAGGFIGRCLVISLPGSEKAVREGMQALEPMLPHLFSVRDGAKH